MTELITVGYVQLKANIARIEAAARVKSTITHDREKRSHLVTVRTQREADAFHEAAEHIGLDIG